MSGCVFEMGVNLPGFSWIIDETVLAVMTGRYGTERQNRRRIGTRGPAPWSIALTV